MQMSAAMPKARSTISRAPSSVFPSSARAAAWAKPLPEPMAIRSSSGSSTSPVPVMISDASRIGDAQHRLEPAQHAVGAPVLGQLHGGAGQVALVLLELALEALEQREGIGGGAGETRP
jgi:hypothetical protein